MKSKSSLFLIELIISTLFFALAATVCVQLFVKAHLINVENEEKNQAILWTQNVSEAWISFDGNLEDTAELFPEAIIDGGTLYLYFDGSWNHVSEENAAYSLVLSTRQDDTYHYGTVAVYNVGNTLEAIYSTDLLEHISERSSHE